jgi:hypothetical protein
MIAVRVVQASIDQIINMITVGNSLMAAVWAMPMLRIMPGSAMIGVAPIGVCRADFKHVLFGAPVLNMLQMAVVEIIDVVLVANANMAASGTVHMRLIGGGHASSSFHACFELAAQHGVAFRHVRAACFAEPIFSIRVLFRLGS